GHEDGARVAEAHRTLEMPSDVDEPLDRAALVAHGHARGEHTLEAVAVPTALPRRLATLTRTAHDERDAAPGGQLEVHRLDPPHAHRPVQRRVARQTKRARDAVVGGLPPGRGETQAREVAHAIGLDTLAQHEQVTLAGLRVARERLGEAGQLAHTSVR